MENRNDIHGFRERVNLYFDNQLNKEEEDSLLQEVNTDPSRGVVFKKEKNFREFIKNNVKRSTVSPDLIQNIRDRIKIR